MREAEQFAPGEPSLSLDVSCGCVSAPGGGLCGLISPAGTLEDDLVLEQGDLPEAAFKRLPGDDGTVGTAGSYIVKWDTNNITTANFNSATTYTQGGHRNRAGGAKPKSD
jgi:hypothetical protein